MVKPKFSIATPNRHRFNNPLTAVCVVGMLARKPEADFFVLLFVFATVGSIQAIEIDRFTFCRFKHTDGHKYAC